MLLLPVYRVLVGEEGKWSQASGRNVPETFGPFGSWRVGSSSCSELEVPVLVETVIVAVHRWAIWVLVVVDPFGCSMSTQVVEGRKSSWWRWKEGFRGAIGTRLNLSLITMSFKFQGSDSRLRGV